MAEGAGAGVLLGATGRREQASGKHERTAQT
jgi:hypothetical protein